MLYNKRTLFIVHLVLSYLIGPADVKFESSLFIDETKICHLWRTPVVSQNLYGTRITFTHVHLKVKKLQEMQYTYTEMFTYIN